MAYQSRILTLFLCLTTLGPLSAEVLTLHCPAVHPETKKDSLLGAQLKDGHWFECSYGVGFLQFSIKLRDDLNCSLPPKKVRGGGLRPMTSCLGDHRSCFLSCTLKD